MGAIAAALLIGAYQYTQTKQASKEAKRQREEAEASQKRLEQEAKDRMAKEEANKARDLTRRRLAGSREGTTRSTILTSPLGLPGDSAGQRNTLLGA